MKLVKNTWNRGLIGKLIVGLFGLTACCCVSTFIAAIAPGSTTPRAAAPNAAFVASVPTLQATATITPATEAPTATAQPTAPTSEPTAAPTDPPAPTATPEPAAPVGPAVSPIEAQANVRAGPGTDYVIVGTLAQGQTAPIMGKSADGARWQIDLAGTPGWVRGDVVTVSGALDGVTVAEVPPTEVAVAPAQPVAVEPSFSDGVGAPNSSVSPPWWPCQEGQIKANNNSGIYHRPGGASYAKTFKNVTCYNTEGEVDASRFRAAER